MQKRIEIRSFILLLAFALALPAQQVIAPTGEPVGPPRGESIGDYNITNWFETGYRWHEVSGNEGTYRSDVNYGNGIRLLGSNLTINSKEGHGHYFDELLLSTSGLGNDPYEFVSLRVRKNRLYQYDMTWRENAYYNPALPIALGEHFIDTMRRFHDHSLVLFPDSKLKFFLGYARNSQSGPALTTMQLFNPPGDEFPLFANIRRLQDEYRLGGELQLFGVKLSVVRGWEHFRDDTADSSFALEPGNNPNDPITLTNFQRTQPYHGTTSDWRVNLISDRSKLYSINGRFAYAEGRRNFLYDENVLGTGRFGPSAVQTLVTGDARRPVLAANLTLSIFPTAKLTIANHSAFNNTRIDGNGIFTQLQNADLIADVIHFQFLGIRTFTNQTDVNYRLTSQVGLYAGYAFSTRQIRSIEQQTVESNPLGITAQQDNTLHTGTFGLRLRPVKPLTINLDAEIGRTDRPFYPISERNYHALNGRVQYRYKTLTLTAAAKTNYNTNSVSLSSFSSHARTYSADASWTPLNWLSFDADYNKLHLDTASGIAYFLNGDVVNGRSIYVSNIHAGNLGMRFNLRNKASLSVAYTRVQDTGDGSTPAGANLVLATPPGSLLPAASEGVPDFFQVFPLTFESPSAKLSVRISEKLRWNAGYQFYRYREDFASFSALQNYRAHTGYTSVSWSF